ncbi:hypothetical protein EB118_21575 [bacterium]|nr:hypothetical protein [bacterium]NDC95635.1 hypothetical protein [bacterium]NDD85244.1 hypothetical protein [bacterium]NDG32650.1 hypothetical protein [bacterium]
MRKYLPLKGNKQCKTKRFFGLLLKKTTDKNSRPFTGDNEGATAWQNDPDTVKPELRRKLDKLIAREERLGTRVHGRG